MSPLIEVFNLVAAVLFWPLTVVGLAFASLMTMAGIVLALSTEGHIEHYWDEAIFWRCRHWIDVRWLALRLAWTEHLAPGIFRGLFYAGLVVAHNAGHIILASRVAMLGVMFELVLMLLRRLHLAFSTRRWVYSVTRLRSIVRALVPLRLAHWYFRYDWLNRIWYGLFRSCYDHCPYRW